MRSEMVNISLASATLDASFMPSSVTNMCVTANIAALLTLLNLTTLVSFLIRQDAAQHRALRDPKRRVRRSPRRTQVPVSSTGSGRSRCCHLTASMCDDCSDLSVNALTDLSLGVTNTSTIQYMYVPLAQ